MYVVFLKFSDGKARAPEHMAAHKQWIAEGVEEGTFLLVGSLQPQAGGAILVDGPTRAELDARLARDPFVEHDVVRPEVFEIAPNTAVEPLAFLVRN